MKKYHISRKTTQIIFLTLFLYLMSQNKYPLNFFLPTDFFLRIDPLSAIAVMGAGRELAARFWPAIITLVSAIVLGRFFCGWICPLGTVIDATDKIVKRPKKEKTSWYIPHIKYLLLILIVICAVFSFQFIFFLDPLVIITRTATLSVFPIFYYLAESSLVFLAKLPFVGNFFFDIYASMKGTAIPVQEMNFFQGLPVLLIFLGILLLGKISKRYWCRNLCPLGALLGFLGKFSFFGRWIGEDCTECMMCTTDCKMGTIKDDISSSQAECILCLNCHFECPEEEVLNFGFHKPDRAKSKLDIDRRRFLKSTGWGLALMGIYRVTPIKIDQSGKSIRPPGAVEEDKFLDLCLRCQQCTGVCSTTGKCLQPAVSEAGIEGLWTPVAKMREGYCEYNCNLCGQVCPSGAIKPLEIAEKQKLVMGTAFFDGNRCIPYYREEECLVCEEHCPTPDKAIKFKEKLVEKDGETTLLKVPYVIESLCIGCGICENKCPIDGRAGIFVTRQNAQRGEQEEESYGGYGGS